MKATPVPIPNTEVKLHSAESSWRNASCEGRTLPCKLGRGFPRLFYYFDKNGKLSLIKLYLFMKGDENHENA